MSKTGEQTVRVLDEAYKTIRSGAPGLSDQTCNVLAGIIARKVSIIYAQPHPSQQAGVEGALREEAERMVTFAQALCDAADHYGVKHLDSDDMDDEAVNLEAATIAMRHVLADCLAALKPMEG